MAGLAKKQGEIGLVEQGAREIRIFQPTIIPGLLQSSGYAQAVMATPHGMLSDAAADLSQSALLAAVGRRVERQQILGVPGKRFFFLITESALGHWLGTPHDMLAQIEHLRTVGRQPNVTLGVIPAGVRLADPPLHGFEILDGNWLFVDLFNTSLTSRGHSDILLYRQLFDRLWKSATTDVDDILDRHARTYHGLAG